MKFVCGLALVLLITGCTVTRTRPVDGELRRVGQAVRVTPGILIEGYVTSDGVKHPGKGYLQQLESGDLLFRSFAGLGKPECGPTVLRREDVTALVVRRPELFSTLFAGAAGLACLAAGWATLDDDDDDIRCLLEQKLRGPGPPMPFDVHRYPTGSLR